MDAQQLLALDNAHVWHPYSAIGAAQPIFSVASANGVRLKLVDGRELIDGMSSWWSAIHGYNHPVMNLALQAQIEKMSHVMFGGLTHEPAVLLASRLIELTPAPLQTVFFSDSGSVSVEVAMKMAIQFWHAKGSPAKQRFLTLRNGYHGDTFGAMSVCDPVTGMHSLFSDVLTEQYFVDAPACQFGGMSGDEGITRLKQRLERHVDNIAAIILEPIVQATGGMNFYSADYLSRVRTLCDEHEVLLICDEIATGFGRTGKMFACEHADISPDIMCVGKALTGGYLSLAATLTTENISATIREGEPGLFMHGPTFMANPLACSAALASLKLLTDVDWSLNIIRIEAGLERGLSPCCALSSVANVRVLGGIGVVELNQAVDMRVIQPLFVEHGVWVRPFGRLVYLMPPYVISDHDLAELTAAVVRVVESISE
ncbi:MAG: adenosylmethionine--8-amino-7-oxononanoate transaminase [Gammaproteobacteria bacterium]|nr:adenosylmethionine--8-amino-7-oxononanoate transaminase [Gammaproteobacteria bacterium]